MALPITMTLGSDFGEPDELNLRNCEGRSVLIDIVDKDYTFKMIRVNIDDLQQALDAIAICKD